MSGLQKTYDRTARTLSSRQLMPAGGIARVMLAGPMPAPWSLAPPARRQGFTLSPRETPTDMQDDVLVNRIAGSDHDAFAALYDRHSALVYGVARRLLGDGPQAEDVAQSVFLQVWTRPEAFRGGNS